MGDLLFGSSRGSRKCVDSTNVGLFGAAGYVSKIKVHGALGTTAEADEPGLNDP